MKRENEIETDFYIIENDLSDITVEMVLAILLNRLNIRRTEKLYTNVLVI